MEIVSAVKIKHGKLELSFQSYNHCITFACFRLPTYTQAFVLLFPRITSTLVHICVISTCPKSFFLFLKFFFYPTLCSFLECMQKTLKKIAVRQQRLIKKKYLYRELNLPCYKASAQQKLDKINKIITEITDCETLVDQFAQGQDSSSIYVVAAFSISNLLFHCFNAFYLKISYISLTLGHFMFASKKLFLDMLKNSIQ